MIGLVPIAALVLTGWAEEQHSLLGAPPLVGRATAEGATLTVHGGERDVEVLLELRADVERAGRWRPFLAEDSVPLAALALPGRTARGWRGTLGAAARDAASSDPSWIQITPGEYCELVLRGLTDHRAWRWRLRVREAGESRCQGVARLEERFNGRLSTVAPPGESFTFALISDMHFFIEDLGPRFPPSEIELGLPQLHGLLRSVEWFRRTREQVTHDFRQVAQRIRADRPEFVVGLGDHFDLHGLEFNSPFFTRGQAESAHGETRALLAENLATCGAVYQLIGNWEAESGHHPPSLRELAIHARRRHQVNPRPDTSGLGGGAAEDYYAWRWGDALLLALNVRGYTPTVHNLGGPQYGEGGPADFTLGEPQKRFAEEVLRGSEQRYKIVLLHHVVGGAAADQANSAYGRGGGNAARVGEQQWLHELMLQTGVQVLFYGHDHVFTDVEVDGIHYTLPGTTGAPWRFGPEVTGYANSWPDAGYGRVQVTPERMRVELVSAQNGVLLAYDVAPRSPTEDESSD